MGMETLYLCTSKLCIYMMNHRTQSYIYTQTHQLPGRGRLLEVGLEVQARLPDGHVRHLLI